MKRGDTLTVREALAAGADVNARSTARETSLHISVQPGGIEIPRLLLEHGADVNARDMGGRTPLYLVCLNLKYKEDLAHLLLDHGADAKASEGNGITVLHAACLYGTSVALRLIRTGADPEVEDGNGTTPYHVACTTGNTGVIRFLLEQGIKGAATYRGLSPLDCAMKLSPAHPAREEILDLFRQYAPELVMEAYCVEEPRKPSPHM